MASSQINIVFMKLACTDCGVDHTYCVMSLALTLSCYNYVAEMLFY